MATVVQKKLDERKAYWRIQLSGPLPTLALPLDHPRPPVPSFVKQTESVTLDSKFRDRINTLVSNEKTSLYTVLLAAFKTLLFRYTGQQDIIVGSLMQVEKDNQVAKESVINLVALRTNVSDGLSVEALIRLIDRSVKEAGRHIDYPFESVMDAIEHDPNRDGMLLFNTAFVFGESLLVSYDFEQYLAECDLVFLVNEEDAGLELSWQYDADIFEPETICRMLGHVQVLLDGMLVNPTIRLSMLPLLTEAERRQLLVEWNATEAEYPKEVCLHQLFETQVERTPDAVAVVVEEQWLTYAELNRRANQLARHLQRLGVGPEVLVAILAERSLEMIIGLLGILKVGGAYVPLDQAYPKERLALMLEDTGAPVLLLTQQRLLKSLPEHRAHVVCLDSDWGSIAQYPNENLINEVQPTTLAYVIYTSGSTGKPKGVAIEHRSAVTFVHWVKDVFSPEELAGVLASTSICFDLSVFELFATLSWGGKVIMVENALEVPNSPAADQVILVNTVPSIIAGLLRAGGLPESVRTVNLAGEPLKAQLVQQIYEQSAVEKVYDLYGPSEDTTYSTFTLRTSDGPATIGRPIANTQVYILDRNHQPVPVGVPGELHLGGDCLARGYLNRPELTAEKFIANPFSEAPQARLYKTGDLARYLPDGNIEYLGRLDHQVKIRGFRIELGEIEAVLERHPDVRHALLVARDDTPLMTQLAAYIVPRDREKQPEIWPSTGEYQIWDDTLYHLLANDLVRLDRYKNAIEALVWDKDVVEIGTGADVLLARLCIDAGARRVYAIEIQDDAFRQAQKRITALGLEDRIILIHGDSRLVSLPRKVDICVSEVIGSIGGSQGAAPLLKNARRFLKDSGTMIPQRCTTRMAAIELPATLLETPTFTDLSKEWVSKIFQKSAREFDLRLCIKNFPPNSMISDVRTFEDLDFLNLNEVEHQHSASLRITRDSQFSGFLLWIHLELGADQVLDSLEHECLWLPVFFPIFHPPIPVTEGDVLDINTRSSIDENSVFPNYHISGTLFRDDTAVEEFSFDSRYENDTFRETSFYKAIHGNQPTPVEPRQKTILSSKLLRSYLKHYLPHYMVPASFTFLESLPLLANGKINRRALPAPSEERQVEELPAAPNNELEEKIARSWKAALKIETVGVHDNFFDLGGHSLLLASIHGDLKVLASKKLRIVDLYAYPTIHSLATFLQNNDQNTVAERAQIRATKQLGARRDRRPSVNQRKSSDE